MPYTTSLSWQAGQLYSRHWIRQDIQCQAHFPKLSTHLHPTWWFLHSPFTAQRKDICSVTLHLKHSEEGGGRWEGREGISKHAIHPRASDETLPHISSQLCSPCAQRAEPVSSQSRRHMKGWGHWGSWEHYRKSGICLPKNMRNDQHCSVMHLLFICTFWMAYQLRTYTSGSKSFLSWGMVVSLLTRWKTYLY